MKVKFPAIRGMRGNGGGPNTNFSRTGSKSWNHRITVNGRLRAIDRECFPPVPLAKALLLAHGNCATAAPNPLAVKRRTKVAKPHHAAVLRSRWTPRDGATASSRDPDGRHWNEASMSVLCDIAVKRIGHADVLAVLTPRGTLREESAGRVRQRIRTVLLHVGHGTWLRRAQHGL